MAKLKHVIYASPGAGCEEWIIWLFGVELRLGKYKGDGLYYPCLTSGFDINFQTGFETIEECKEFMIDGVVEWFEGVKELEPNPI